MSRSKYKADIAGGSANLELPDTISLLLLPPYAPELNPVENIWAYLRANKLAISIFETYDEIVGACCKAWNFFASITEACTGTGVAFTWAFDGSGTAHSRDIVTDTGWKIVLDRGLDIFQPPVKRNGFNLSDRLQEHRMIKSFYVTYLRGEDEQGVL